VTQRDVFEDQLMISAAGQGQRSRDQHNHPAVVVRLWLPTIRPRPLADENADPHWPKHVVMTKYATERGSKEGN
jgi:hypothetical protein